MSEDDQAIELDSSLDLDPLAHPAVVADGGPLGPLPRVDGRLARLESALARAGRSGGLNALSGWLGESSGKALEFGAAEIHGRPSGLNRAGAVAQFVWPRLAMRFGVGLETPLAHALVDRLLGADRPPEEGRLQVSPVEWGVLTYVVAETLNRLDATPGPLGAWDILIDRVSADAFDASGLGRVVTVRWPLRIGTVQGSLRAWIPESLVARWLDARPSSSAASSRGERGRPPAEWAGLWVAVAGTVSLPRGLRTLRTGGVLPLTDCRLGGTPASPSGPVPLILVLAGRSGRCVIPAEPVPKTGGARLTVTDRSRHEPTPREPIAVTTHPSPTPPAGSAATPPVDVPLTLVVELGRVNLTLSRVAELKPGDVVPLGRHSREPVELTSGGRLVARGELVQIDTELGVRVTHVFL